MDLKRDVGLDFVGFMSEFGFMSRVSVPWAVVLFLRFEMHMLIFGEKSLPALIHRSSLFFIHTSQTPIISSFDKLPYKHNPTQTKR